MSAATKIFLPNHQRQEFVRSSAPSVWRVPTMCLAVLAQTVAVSLLLVHGARQQSWQIIRLQRSAFLNRLGAKGPHRKWGGACQARRCSGRSAFRSPLFAMRFVHLVAKSFAPFRLPLNLAQVPMETSADTAGRTTEYRPCFDSICIAGIPRLLND